MTLDSSKFATVSLTPFYAFDVNVPAAGLGFDVERYRAAYIEGLKAIHRYWQGIETCDVHEAGENAFERTLDLGNGVRLRDRVEVSESGVTQWIVQPDGTLYGRHDTHFEALPDGNLVVKFSCALIEGARGETPAVEAVREQMYKDKDEHFALSVAEELGEALLKQKAGA